MSKIQRTEIDELKNEKRNRLLAVSERKRSHVSVQNQWSVQIDEETIDNTANNEDQSVIRNGLYCISND